MISLDLVLQFLLDSLRKLLGDSHHIFLALCVLLLFFKTPYFHFEVLDFRVVISLLYLDRRMLTHLGHCDLMTGILGSFFEVVAFFSQFLHFVCLSLNGMFKLSDERVMLKLLELEIAFDLLIEMDLKLLFNRLELGLVLTLNF